VTPQQRRLAAALIGAAQGTMRETTGAVLPVPALT
jgi:hypothetical protein